MLGDRIKELRFAQKLSQVDLAKKLGVSKQTISNWENGNIQPSIYTLVRIAKFYGVSTDYLLELKGNQEQLLDTASLTKEEIEHIQFIINDICKSRK